MGAWCSAGRTPSGRARASAGALLPLWGRGTPKGWRGLRQALAHGPCPLPGFAGTPPREGREARWSPPAPPGELAAGGANGQIVGAAHEIRAAQADERGTAGGQPDGRAKGAGTWGWPITIPSPGGSPPSWPPRGRRWPWPIWRPTRSASGRWANRSGSRCGPPSTPPATIPWRPPSRWWRTPGARSISWSTPSPTPTAARSRARSWTTPPARPSPRPWTYPPTASWTPRAGPRG